MRLKLQSTQKNVLVMYHLRWNMKTHSKLALLLFLVLHIIPKLPLFLFWNLNFTQISNLKKISNKKSIIFFFRLQIATSFWLLFLLLLLVFWVKKQSWRIETLVGGGKKRYLMGIGKKWVDEKKIERKI